MLAKLERVEVRSSNKTRVGFSIGEVVFIPDWSLEIGEPLIINRMTNGLCKFDEDEIIENVIDFTTGGQLSNTKEVSIRTTRYEYYLTELEVT